MMSRFRRQPMNPDEAQVLADSLNAALTRLGLSDSAFARRAGVDQPMIWRAKRALLRRWTTRVRQLDLFVRMTIGAPAADIPAEAMSAVGAYFAAGGRLDLLCEAVRVLRDAQSSAARPPHSRSPPSKGGGPVPRREDT
jgi:hypothetical protein